ncbi:hypothetical protein pb186bvf_012995 [Paramecium bursaria]
MRLLIHNLLMCNVSKCDQNNYPLIIKVDKSIIVQTEFKQDLIVKLIQKLDFQALSQTVKSLGDDTFPEQIPQDFIKDLQFLQRMHRILYETHIITGELTCPNPQCQRTYPIVNGIPNMILTEDEI